MKQLFYCIIALLLGSNSLFAQSWQQTDLIEDLREMIGDGEIKARNTAISGDWAMVSDQTRKTEVNGEEEEKVGIVYIFHKKDGKWQYMQTIEPKTPEKEMRFGSSMAMFGDHAIIGAMGHHEKYTNKGKEYDVNAGAVFFLKRNGNQWEVNGDMVIDEETDERGRPMSKAFGRHVAMHGQYAIVGDGLRANALSKSGTGIERYGAATIFKLQSNGQWAMEKLLLCASPPTKEEREKGYDSSFGSDVDIFDTGSGYQAIVGDWQQGITPRSKITPGAAFIFENGSLKKEIQGTDLEGSMQLGSEIAINGEYALVSSGVGDDKTSASKIKGVYLFKKSSGWEQAHLFEDHEKGTRDESTSYGGHILLYKNFAFIQGGGHTDIYDLSDNYSRQVLEGKDARGRTVTPSRPSIDRSNGQILVSRGNTQLFFFKMVP